MKSNIEIFEMLIHDCLKIDKDIISSNKDNYLNSSLGDISFLLSSFFESILKSHSLISNDIWFDDSLITKFLFNKLFIEIEGFIIWGKINTTNQWVSPFNIKINFLNSRKNSNYTILLKFGIEDDKLISYENIEKIFNFHTSTDMKWLHKLEFNFSEFK
jgi:hypothetical protein